MNCLAQRLHHVLNVGSNVTKGVKTGSWEVK